MCLLVDDRVGSADLADPLRRLGLPVEVCRLDAGDVAFQGRGPDDVPLSVGVELKKLTTSDFADSSRSGRLNVQRNKMLGKEGLYDYGWLVVEGRYRVTSQGLIEVWKGRRKFGREEWEQLRGLNASQLQKRVLTQELCGGFHVHFTDDHRSTVLFVADLYRWWTDTAADRHSSHLAAHTQFGFLPLSAFRQAVVGGKWPGVGLKTSLAAETQFRTIIRAVTASVDEWAGVTTIDQDGRARRFGTKAAEKLVGYFKGRS